MRTFFVNRFRFRINNGKWSYTSEIRISETNPFGVVMNILSIKICSLVSYSRRFGNYRYERLRQERIKKVQCVFVIIIVQDMKIEISTQNNFVITISRNNTSSSVNLSEQLQTNKSIALALGGP